MTDLITLMNDQLAREEVSEVRISKSKNYKFIHIALLVKTNKGRKWVNIYLTETFLNDHESNLKIEIQESIKEHIKHYDTSLLLGSMYGQDIETCLEMDSQFRPAINVFVMRGGEFETSGRLQSLEESIEIDQKIINMLDENNIDYIKLFSRNAEYLSRIVRCAQNDT